MKKTILLAGTGFTLLLSSCYPSLYFSDRVQTTAFTDKNQFVLNGSLKPQITPNDSTNQVSGAASYSVDAAYSISENWAITGFYSNVNNRRVREDQNPFSFGNRLGGVHNGNRYEIGVTYFDTDGKDGIYELSGGFSRGELTRTSIFTPQYNFTTYYNTYFLQGAYSLKYDYFVLSTGGKLWLQHFYAFNSIPEVRHKYDSKNTNVDISRFPFVFLNPFLNMEFGYKFIKFNTQVGAPIQFTGRNVAGFPFYMTFGMVFRLEKDIFKQSNPHKTTDEKLQ